VELDVDVHVVADRAPDLLERRERLLQVCRRDPRPASVHLALNSPNALVQEVVRAFYSDWYRELVTALPPLDRGFITAPAGPGLGIELAPDLTRRPDAIVRTSGP
jgi:hypothetical protein